MKALPRILGRPATAIARSAAAGIVTLTLLFPKATQAEDVEPVEVYGDYDEDGQRFGAVVIRGTLEAIPGGWTLVRTYENKSEDAAEITLEEVVSETESMVGARVLPPGKTVLTRTQTLRLAAHEKKKVGTSLPAALSASMTKAHDRQHWASAQLLAGKSDGDATFGTFAVAYVRPLAAGQTLKKADVDPDVVTYVPKKPERIPVLLPPPTKAKSAPKGLE